MKYLSKLFLLAAITVTFSACEKVNDLPFYPDGSPVTLTASTTTIASTPADSNKVALALNWTSPNYATDSSKVKYILELDVAGRNFSDPYVKEILGGFTTEFLAKEINTIALNYGLDFGKAYDMEVRIISSYANNNERLTSNLVKLKVTPYKIPPKVKLPESGNLFIVGNATGGGWNENMPIPSQQFSRLDETTFGGVFELSGGNQYLILPVRGSWNDKYTVANSNAPGGAEGGDFGYMLSDNFAGPANSGWYKIILNFQTGKYTVTPYGGHIPEILFMVGNATPGDWSNPVPVPSQQLTRLNSSEFELTLDLNANGKYIFLPVNGSWDNKYAVADDGVAGLSMGGELGYNYSKDIPGPVEGGTYKVNVNFAAGDQGRFKLTKQ